MAGAEPISVTQLGTGGREQASWERARELLAETDTYWLATVRPDGRPHVMPVLAVWADGALHFSTGAHSRKGRNLARDGRCVVTADTHICDLVLEGEAVRLTDEALLQRVADAYAAKYQWSVTVRGGAFHAEGAPTAGPPPYDVYRVAATVAFAFGTDGSFPALRWLF